MTITTYRLRGESILRQMMRQLPWEYTSHFVIDLEDGKEKLYQGLTDFHICQEIERSVIA